ncbi:MAG: hypothetical protein AAFO91_13530 [Bacteroidota bacterium]
MLSLFIMGGIEDPKGTELSRTPIKESGMNQVVHQFGQTDEAFSIPLPLSPPAQPEGKGGPLSTKTHLSLE